MQNTYVQTSSDTPSVIYLEKNKVFYRIVAVSLL